MDSIDRVRHVLVSSEALVPVLEARLCVAGMFVNVRSTFLPKTLGPELPSSHRGACHTNSNVLTQYNEMCLVVQSILIFKFMTNQAVWPAKVCEGREIGAPTHFGEPLISELVPSSSSPRTLGQTYCSICHIPSFDLGLANSR